MEYKQPLSTKSPQEMKQRPDYEPPVVTSHTAAEILEAMGPAWAIYGVPGIEP